jgi:hypothetical protein
MRTNRRILSAAGIAAGLTAVAATAFVTATPTAAVSGSPAPPMRQAAETLRFVSKDGTMTSIDLGAKGLGSGDEYILSDKLYTDGRRVGRDAGTCTVVTAGGDAVCDLVLVLPAGHIVVHGLLPATAHEFPLAVTGGTGRYATARGEVLLRQGETSSSLTVTLAPPAG